jgi:hypothetical protein
MPRRHLTSGVAAAVSAASNWLGGLTTDDAVLEADEDALPALARALPPDVLVLTNLFRDQLDRYGEVIPSLGVGANSCSSCPSTRRSSSTPTIRV